MSALVMILMASAVADLEGPRIEHGPQAKARANEPVTITANIDDPSGVYGAELFFRVVGESKFSSLTLQTADERTYTVEIPGVRVTGDIEYYIESYDDSGNGPSRAGDQFAPLHLLVEKSSGAFADLPVPPPEEKSFPLAQTLTTGAGVVLLAVGAILYGGASGQVDTIDAKYSAQPTQGRIPQDHAAIQSAKTKGLAGSALMAAGGAVAIGGGAWIALSLMDSGTDEHVLVAYRSTF